MIMQELTIRNIAAAFHEKSVNRDFIEQTRNQIRKDAQNLCEVPEFEPDHSIPVIEQFIEWIASIEEAILKKGNHIDQFYYLVDLPESVMKELKKEQSNESNRQIHELILYREAQKVFIRNHYAPDKTKNRVE